MQVLAVEVTGGGQMYAYRNDRTQVPDFYIRIGPNTAPARTHETDDSATATEHLSYWWCDKGPYYRTPPPTHVVCCQTKGMDFDRDTERQAVAVHEAGHAAVALQLGLHLPPVSLTDPTELRVCGHLAEIEGALDNLLLDGATVAEMMTVLAAGERAEDRWLRETGLWTVTRAFFAERSAFADRDVARVHLAVYGQDLCFGTSTAGAPDAADWWRANGLAGAALDGIWDNVLVLAGRIAEAGALSGDAAAAVCGMANPVPGAPQA